MKFTLNEEKAKILLQERFILKEADEDTPEAQPEGQAAPEESKIKTAVKDNLAKYTDTLKQDLIDLVDGLFTSQSKELEGYDIVKTEAADAIKRADWGAVEGPINAFTQKIRDMANNAKNLGTGSPLNAAPELKRALDLADDLAKRLKGRLSGATKGKIVINDLEQKFNEITEIIAETIKSNTPPYDANTVEITWDAINNTSKAVEALTENSDAEEAILRKLDPTLVDIEVKANTKADLKQIAENLKTIKEGCDTFIRDIESSDEFKEKQKQYKAPSQDWEERLQAAYEKRDQQEVNKIWDEYYQTEWGNDASSVKKLGRAFTTELHELGFSEAQNPFITFVKYALAHKFTLDINKYNAIHNAYIDKSISKDDLRKTSLLAAADKNLLYSKALYAKSGQEIATLLKLQTNVKNQYENRADALKNLYQSTSDLGDFIVMIFNDQIPENEIAKKKSTSNFASNSNLRSISNIKRIMTAALGEGSTLVKKDKPKASSDQIINAARTRNVLKYLPAYIAAFYGRGNDKFVEEADKLPLKYEAALRDFNKVITKTLGEILGGWNPESNWLTVEREVVKAILEDTK